MTTVTTKLAISPETWKQGKSPLLDSWLLYSDPLSVSLILFAYLAFVLYLGPKFMEKQEPYNIKMILILYNVVKVFYNFGVLVWSSLQPNALKYFLNFGCVETDEQQELDFQTTICVIIWHMTIIKLMDLLDTVFFVLRKAKNRITFLHLQHHILSLTILWIFGKYFTGQELAISLVCNTIVHMIMYFYYLVAALGPAFKKYLWWKKYVTMIQIGQFLIMIAYMLASLWLSCGYNPVIVSLLILNASLNFALFLKFYFDTYHPKKDINGGRDTYTENNQNA